MAQSIEAYVNPAMLVWARKYASTLPEHAASSLKIPLERLQAWERGEERPTINQAYALAKKYRQLFSVFYLSDPPFPLTDRQLKDFRRLDTGEQIEYSHALNYEIRDAFEKREILLELLKSLEWNIPMFDYQADVTNAPDKIAEELRNYLGISVDTQKNWRNKNTFDLWRRFLHKKGIMVLQATGISVKEMRGFSISLFPYPVLVVNRKDAEAGRIFTVFHELAHVSLRLSGICDLSENQVNSEVVNVETWCNSVAAAALVPQADLLREPEIYQHKGKAPDWSDNTLRLIANRYGVSAEVVLRRLLTLELTTKDFYEDRRAKWLVEYESNLRQVQQSGFLPPAQDAISAYGKDYSITTFEAYRANKISFGDLSSYMGLKYNQLNKARILLEGAL